MVMGACQTIRIPNVLKYFGVIWSQSEPHAVKTDVNAAVSNASRRGQGEVKVVKVKGIENPADHLTKGLSAEGKTDTS